MKYTFGPVSSRRFGISLGIDVSPNAKQCNFDCLYCELERAKPIEHYKTIAPLEAIIDEVKASLSEDIDVLTITANGEPTLYPHLGALVEALNTIKGERKLLILSNGSTIMKPHIQKTLSNIDIVKLSLDCVSEKCFKKLDRAHKSVELHEIIAGIEQFRKNFAHSLILEILLVQGIEIDIERFNELLPKLGAERIDIGTIDRPPAYDVKALSYHELYEIATRFDASLPIHITARKPKESVKPFSLNAKEILNTLAKRPLTHEDIAILFDSATQERMDALQKANKIAIKTINNVAFYCAP